MSVQAAPMTIATSDRTIQPTTIGSVDMTPGPRPATKAAASRYWPSVPRFQRLARKAKMSPHPMSRSGAMRVMVSKRPDSRTMPAVMMSSKKATGSTPSSASMTADVSSASPSGISASAVYVAHRDRRPGTGSAAPIASGVVAGVVTRLVPHRG